MCKFFMHPPASSSRVVRLCRSNLISCWCENWWDEFQQHVAQPTAITRSMFNVLSKHICRGIYARDKNGRNWQLKKVSAQIKGWKSVEHKSKVTVEGTSWDIQGQVGSMKKTKHFLALQLNLGQGLWLKCVLKKNSHISVILKYKEKCIHYKLRKIL